MTTGGTLHTRGFRPSHRFLTSQDARFGWPVEGKLRSPERGFSLIELLLVVAIILIIVAIAIPSFMRSRMAANESAAVSYLRAVNTASATYHSTYGNGFPPSLSALGPPPGGGAPTCDNAEILDGVTACAAPPCRKSGYDFDYGIVVPRGAPALGCAVAGADAYAAEALPALMGSTGQRSFCTDHRGVIRQDPSGAPYGVGTACPTAGANSQPIN